MKKLPAEFDSKRTDRGKEREEESLLCTVLRRQHLANSITASSSSSTSAPSKEGFESRESRGKKEENTEERELVISLPLPGKSVKLEAPEKQQLLLRSGEEASIVLPKFPAAAECLHYVGLWKEVQRRLGKEGQQRLLLLLQPCLAVYFSVEPRWARQNFAQPMNIISSQCLLVVQYSGG